MPERAPEAPAERRAAPPADWAEEHRETVVAVFGDSARAGAWYPPERLNAVAGFGNVSLDFCDADLPAGPTEIRAFAIFGNVNVRVPRHVDVELNGVSLFGSIKHHSDRKVGKKLIDRVLGKPERAPAPPQPEDDDEDRWLVVRGFAVFGNVKVTVVDP